jgi:anti-sigma factor RsiW
MKCNDIREMMPDLAAGLSAATPEMDEHLRSCAECTAGLEEMRKTMALLDEWPAPQPSPYCDVRLQARLREEIARPQTGWLLWIRRPALALALTLLMAVGVALIGVRSFDRGLGRDSASLPAIEKPEPGTAVGDLQALEKNHELYADFDVLDDLQVQPEVTANP